MGDLPTLRLGESCGANAPLILAPLEGITTAPYRRTLFRLYGGFDGGIAPFIGTIRRLKRYDYHLRDILPEVNPASPPLIPQVLGADPEGIRTVAEAVKELGYTQLNWNIGCPIPNIVRKRRGSGILPFPEEVEAVLQAACRVDLPAFSVKLRLGLTEPDEWRRLIPVLTAYPLDFIVLHGRTALQMYTGQVDWDSYADFSKAYGGNFLWSGDIFSGEDFLKAVDRVPSCAGFLLGRGALQRPMLAREIRSGRREHFTLREALGFLHELAGEYRRDGHDETWILGKMKLHFSHLRKGCDEAESARELWPRLRSFRTLDQLAGL